MYSCRVTKPRFKLNSRQSQPGVKTKPSSHPRKASGLCSSYDIKVKVLINLLLLEHPCLPSAFIRAAGSSHFLRLSLKL